MKRVLLFTMSMLFAVLAKAELTITPIAGEENAYRITINEPADFDIFNNADNVFYTEDDGTEIKVSDIKKLIIVTKDPHKLNKNKCQKLVSNCTSLSYLDLENCSLENINLNNTNNPLTSFKGMTQLKTLVFPNTDGMVIPTHAFGSDKVNGGENTTLETVIFPDSKGSYQIMSYAFRNCHIQTLSMGKGYSIPDMAQDDSKRWVSASGSGLSIFEHCAQLKNVVLDNSIINLGEKAFQATFSLEYVVLPEELIHMGPLCFKESALRTVTIPDHVVLTGGTSSPQIFQGCVWLRNTFVNADNIPCDIQGVMENGQTMNFKWNPNVPEDDPTYSVNDYVGSGNEAWHSTYSDCPFEGQHYTVPVFHYPGTETAIENYRVPKYLHYSNVDSETGTTWPTKSEINAYVPITVDGVTYRAYSYQLDVNETEYAGWRQFLLGSNTFKEQRVFYDERIKESRWYSICLPINMTEAQFMNAYGVGAALKEFSGAVYDENEKMIVLNFDKDAQVDANGYLLKKNVPYMIHPAKIKMSKRKEITRTAGGVEFVKETVDGQEQYVTKDVIATYDVDNDLFVRWDVLLAGGEPLGDAMDALANNTTLALDMNSVTKSLVISGSNPDNIQPADFNFKGSYLGAEIYGPGDIGGHKVYVGTSPTLPVGAYYLGYDPDHGITTPKFFKSRGIAIWSPYCALIENIGSSSTSGAKVYDVLDIDFNGLSDDNIVSGIGAPTIQIPVMNTDNKVYNLNGQVVRDNAKDLNGLKGIYIVGGKKVVIK